MFLVCDMQQIWFVANVIDPQGGIVENVWFLSLHICLISVIRL